MVNNDRFLKKLISIIIPSYNASDFIDNVLNSVLNQSYLYWECIIINDGSTDGTEEKVNLWIKKDIRFKLVTIRNKGVSSARNEGLKHVRGEYIFFLDSDDLLDKECLNDLIKLTNSDIDIVIGKNASTYGQTKKINKKLRHNKLVNRELSDLDFLELSLREPFDIVVWNKLYSSKFIFSKNLNFIDKILHEDEMWFFETMYYAKNIIFNSKVTYYYNIANYHSITKNYTLKNLKSCIFIINNIYLNYYLKENNAKKKSIIGAYILNLQITTISAFFRFMRFHKCFGFREEGLMMIKKHLKQLNAIEYNQINIKKAKQFEILKLYAIDNPEISYRLIRNLNKNNILKYLENLFLKYKLNLRL
ncbi:MAG: glycosyltransferase family 2 protein [Psychroflexus halocasei]|uniref:glycosyltransferase family 2 protein n=1 Tax=Psychroflexus sp. S27 TaxID=1982757 RepID=UPI000C2A0242|nr:glycosyltransferase family 2 protein [Psychroflexus sp. S27]PJX20750.1 hypothetical protein CAP47_10945 [Psychroflexus sp. S27]